MNETFQETVRKILHKDARYGRDAYPFVMEGLDYAIKKGMKERHTAAPRHVTGKELAEGLRDYALSEFGPMAITVFTEWGIHTTDDFGQIVENLVNAGRIGKQENDSVLDFHDLYDFTKTFVAPYEEEMKNPSVSRRHEKK